MKATHRWNVKSGATRSGKTYMDYFVIPKRIRKCTGRGLICIIGNTQGTLIRNVIDPMRAIWGDVLVGTPNTSASTIKLFGKKCYLLGADNKASVKRLQGAGIEYAYGDEITTWNEEVFQMLKSRLDKPNSCFDGTCNPANPSHWFKKFIDSDADVYNQAYCLDDNPFNTKEFSDNLKKELSGTVYYERFISGKWVAAQGIIYQQYATAPTAFDISSRTIDRNKFISINIGVDFGGTSSGTTFVATAITEGYERLIALKSRKHKITLDPQHLNNLFISFVKEVLDEFGRADNAYCDNAEPILIKGLKMAASAAELPTTVRSAAKTAINGRIRLTSQLMSQNRLFLADDCNTLREALSEALWNDKKTEDERLDDGTTDIDTLDAFEYSFESDRKRLMSSSYYVE